MVLLVKIYVPAERRRAGSGHNEEQIERKNKKHPTRYEDRRDKKVGSVVSFSAAIGRRHEMTPGIVRMMKFDVVFGRRRRPNADDRARNGTEFGCST